MDLQTKLGLTKDHWESSGVESLSDSNLRALEIRSVVSSLQDHLPTGLHPTIADFGCGDGLDTQEFSKHAAYTVGFDYSHEMLRRASRRQIHNVRFTHVDLITDDVNGTYDVVVSKRFVINLGAWPIQASCLGKMAAALAPGGLFVMLECYKQGLENLNRYRTGLDLPSLAEPFHNRYLDYDEAMMLLSRDFTVIETRDFSTYFYLTRCVSPRLAGDKAFDMDQNMRLISEAADILQGAGIGPQRLICLRKK